MFTDFDPDDSEPESYDDRRGDDGDDDCPQGIYAPIVERAENTHMGYSAPDPAIDDSPETPTWDESVVA